MVIFRNFNSYVGCELGRFNRLVYRRGGLVLVIYEIVFVVEIIVFRKLENKYIRVLFTGIYVEVNMVVS